MLATYFADWKIRVNAVAPGLFPSEMTAGMGYFKDGDEPWREGNVAKGVSPLERSGGEEDIAGTALFLASKAGGYLDGCVVIPDGGRLSQLPSSY